MTRLQDAKKQLSEALAALESAASQASNGSYQTDAKVSSSQKVGEAGVAADLSALVDEVSIIESKLDEAIGLIAMLDAGSAQSVEGELDIITDGETQ